MTLRKRKENKKIIENTIKAAEFITYNPSTYTLHVLATIRTDELQQQTLKCPVGRV